MKVKINIQKWRLYIASTCLTSTVTKKKIITTVLKKEKYI